MRFSTGLIQEFQTEMATAYGVAISVEDAQVQLYSLVRCLFGDVGGGAGGRPLLPHPAPREIGDSITPTSGHLDNTYGQEK
jgi:hypothetical protein